MNRNIFLFLTVLFINSCTPSIKLNGVKFNSKIIESFNEIDLSKQCQNIELKISSTETWKFRLITPKHKDGKPKPLVLAMHWAGSSNDYEVFSKCLVEPGFEALDAYIICPSDDKQLWHSPANVKKVLGLVGLATTNWAIDHSKIIVMGYSNGGNGVWYFSDHHSDIFSHGISIASAFQVQQKIDIPLYVIHGYKDELFPLNRTQKWITEAISMGSDIQFVQANNLSHFEACKYVSYLQKGVQALNFHE